MIEEFKNPFIKVIDDRIRVQGKPTALICDRCEAEAPIRGVRRGELYDGPFKNLYTDNSRMPWTFATSPYSDNILVFCGQCVKDIQESIKKGSH
jgi:hypothetical protein